MLTICLYLNCNLISVKLLSTVSTQTKTMTQPTYEDLEKHYSKFVSTNSMRKKLVSFWHPDPKYAHLEDDDYLKSKETKKDFIPLSLGLPNSGFFPIKSMDLNIVDHPFDKSSNLHKHNVATVSKETPVEMDLPFVLQYGDTKGLPPMLEFIENFVKSVGNQPLYNEWDIVIANGSNDSLFKIFETLADETTTVLVEEFSFVPVLSAIYGAGAKAVPTKLNIPVVNKDNYEQTSTVPYGKDDEGIDVEYMSNLLDNWSLGPYKHLKKPTLLYTVTTGQNPTGVSTSMEKKKQIIALAKKHDFIIVEDDPYGYLRMPLYNRSNPDENIYKSADFTTKRYLDDIMIKSYLSLDDDGRVLRLETFSKVFAPGLRLSFIAGNKYIIKQIHDYTEVSTRGASSVSQSLVYSTLKTMSKRDKKPMVEAWLDWIIQVATEYTERRNATLKAAYESEAFKKGYFSVIEPSAGMFVDFEINFKSLNGEFSDIEGMNRINKYFVKNGLGVVLAYKMALDVELSKDHCGLIRTAISFADEPKDLIEAVNRLNMSCVEFFEKRLGN